MSEVTVEFIVKTIQDTVEISDVCVYQQVDLEGRHQYGDFNNFLICFEVPERQEHNLLNVIHSFHPETSYDKDGDLYFDGMYIKSQKRILGHDQTYVEYVLEASWFRNSP